MKTLDVARRTSDEELSRWIKRLSLILVLGVLAFGAFYAVDRWRPAAPAIVDQQVVTLEQAVRDNPNDISVRGQLADAYAAKGRFEDAIGQYDVIIAAGVSLEPANLGRARALQALGRLDEAAAAFEAVIAIAKDGEMAHVDLSLQAAYYGLGWIAMEQDRPLDAITHLEQALAIRRSDADSLYLIGTAFLATGRATEAITVLRASVTFVPVGWSEPYAALGQAYEAAGQPALVAWATAMADVMAGHHQAAEPALLALVDGEAALDAAIGLGLLYETQGDNAQAAEWYGRALAIEPTSNAAGLGLSRVGPVPTAADGSGS
jgi:tetratricopeptide (TPR) repeat protein